MVSDSDIQAIIAQGEPGVNALLEAYDVANASYMQAAIPAVHVIAGTTSSLAQ